MPRSARTLLCLAVATATITACAPRDDAATDTATVAPPATSPPPAATTPAAGPLANAAGRWTVRVNNEAGDSVTAYTMEATSNTTGWMMTLPGRAPIPVNVSVSGDSIITESASYESVLRPGVQVTTRAASVIQGDRITGTARARYQTTGADSVVMLTLDGRRTP